MSNSDAQALAAARILPRGGLNRLISELTAKGYRVVGPRVRDGAIVLEDISSDSDLPIGWSDEQKGGVYRLTKRGDQRVFGFVVGPHSLKRFLFVERRKLIDVDRASNGALRFEKHSADVEQLAVLGARPCDLTAATIQDRIFMGAAYPDADYVGRRANTFVVAVNCSHPASTCFCTSMGAGPRARGSFDLALTELYDDSRHDFLVEVGSETGAAVLQHIDTTPATDYDLQAAHLVTQSAEAAITKYLDTDGIRDLLLENLDHPVWDDVAQRCLSCANCTLACPTCFCSTVEEITDLTQVHAERWQSWDSCFTVDHAYIHGGSVRKSTRSRYRQWMTHKLASWIDQFGTSGCVGCGRCITWCPVGIDITVEAARIRTESTDTKTPV